jgi:hypothetical protein
VELPLVLVMAVAGLWLYGADDPRNLSKALP